jgi:hypothetical protein
MLPINPILAGAAANILVGVALYSQHTFGPMWSKLSGKKTAGLKDMPLRFAIEAVSSLMTASALYIAILTFQKAELSLRESVFTNVYSWFVSDMQTNTNMMASLKIAGFFWLGFMVPHILCHLAWDEHMNARKSVVKAAFTLVHFLAMGAAIAYFG